MSVLLC